MAKKSTKNQDTGTEGTEQISGEAGAQEETTVATVAAEGTQAAVPPVAAEETAAPKEPEFDPEATEIYNPNLGVMDASTDPDSAPAPVAAPVARVQATSNVSAAQAFFDAINVFMEACPSTVPFVGEHVRKQEEELARVMRWSMRTIPEEDFNDFWKTVITIFNDPKNEPLQIHRIHRAGSFWKETEALASFFVNVCAIIRVSADGKAKAKKQFDMEKGLSSIEERIRNKIIHYYA